jgi:hypothetical protein
MTVLWVNVDRAGRIAFEHAPATGLERLPVASAERGDTKRLRCVVSALARHHYDGETLLVPGVPEAKTDNEAVERLNWFREAVAMRMRGEPGWPQLPDALSKETTR